jgi:hypothetical protein
MFSSLRLFKLHVSGWNDFDRVKLPEISLHRSIFSGPKRNSNTNGRELFQPWRDADSGWKLKLRSDWLEADGGRGKKVVRSHGAF